MEQRKCPQCGYHINNPESIRCLRCNKLLMTACNGRCADCSRQNKCKD